MAIAIRKKGVKSAPKSGCVLSLKFGVVAKSYVGPTPAPMIETIARAAVGYYNRHIEIENRRRAANTVRMVELFPDYARALQEKTEAEAAVSDVYDRIKRFKAASRSSRYPKELDDQLRGVKARQKASYVEETWVRKQCWKDETMRAFAAGTEAQAREERNQARFDSKLHWGTYQAVEEAVAAATKKRPGGPLRFKRWHESHGVVALHFQGTAAAPNQMGWAQAILLRGHKGLRLSRPQERWELTEVSPGVKEMRRVEGESKYWMLDFETWDPTAERGTPVTISVPVILHKGQVDKLRQATEWMWFKLFRLPGPRRPGYSVIFTVRTAATVRPTSPEAGVGVNFGWRLRDDGSVRSAYYVGSDGESREIVIPAPYVHKNLHKEHLQSTRDTRVEELKAKLGEYLQSCQSEVHREKFKHLAQWRSAQGLRHAVYWWHENRIAGDDAILAELNVYAGKELHLHEWQYHESDRFKNWRLNFFRHEAKKLAMKYTKLYLSDTDWSDLSLNRGMPADHAKRYKNTACVSELERCLKEAFGKDDVIEMEGEYKTMTCHRCRNRTDTGAKLLHECGCGARWDIDYNHAKNLLDEGVMSIVAV